MRDIFCFRGGFLVTLLFICLSFAGLSRSDSNFGVPFIQNYNQQDYLAGPQNWAITQDENGVIYVANDKGLLTFDGGEWQLYPLPNRTIVRSLQVGPNGRVYAGGQDEVGYFEPDDRGVLTFHSLKPLLPRKYEQFADVFDLVQTDAGLFFRASDRIYRVQDKTVEVLPTEGAVRFLGAAGGKVYVQADGQPLMTYRDGRLQPVAGDTRILRQTNIMGSIELSPDSLLIATFRNGLFLIESGNLTPFRTAQDQWLRDQRVQCAALLANDNIALGSVTGGIMILDRSGTVVQVLSQEEGLQNPNVHSIFVDREHNLWLALDYGIDYLLRSLPMRRIYPDGDLEGTTYTAILYDNRLYCGTPNGLYFAPWKPYYDPFNGNFAPVANATGQVWGLASIDGSLLMGHDEGAFRIEGQQAVRISPNYGHWTFLPLPEHPGFALSGTYFGLELLKKENGQWRFHRKLEGLQESCRITARSADGSIWVSHPYRGVFRIRLTDDLTIAEVQRYDKQTGLPSDLFNYLAQIDGEILVCGKTGIYQYDEQRDTFVTAESLGKYFHPEEQVRRLIEDPTGNIWFVTETDAGLLEVQDQGQSKDIRKIVIPELAGRLVNRFEFIHYIDEHHVLFGTDKGMIILDPVRYQAYTPTLPNPTIKEVFLADSLIARTYEPFQGVTDFSNKQNTLRFRFVIPTYNDMHRIEYQSRLKGWENDWSEWSDKTEREYSRLGAGEYTFQVRARNARGEISEISEYAFRIAPPWYRSPLAYTAYGILVLLFLLLLILIPQRKYQRERAQLLTEKAQQEEQHQRAARASEEKITQLRNEKLKAEIGHKNKELASVTMHLVQKNELLNKLQNKLRKISKESKEQATRKALRQMVNLLKYDDQLDQDWQQFVQHFDQVHDDFFRRLRDEFPQLTPKDHKLCAYLRMNLTSKEIAPLLNISVRGVEISRYRLRKKLNLDSSVNLTEYMMNF